MKIVGSQNKTKVKLTVFNAMHITVKQIKLIIDANIIIPPPIRAFLKQKKQPIKAITNVAKLINGKTDNITLIAPIELEPISIKTSQKIKAEIAPTMLEINPITNAGIDLFIIIHLP